METSKQIHKLDKHHPSLEAKQPQQQQQHITNYNLMKPKNNFNKKHHNKVKSYTRPKKAFRYFSVYFVN